MAQKLVDDDDEQTGTQEQVKLVGSSVTTTTTTAAAGGGNTINTTTTSNNTTNETTATTVRSSSFSSLSPDQPLFASQQQNHRLHPQQTNHSGISCTPDEDEDIDEIDLAAAATEQTMLPSPNINDMEEDDEDDDDMRPLMFDEDSSGDDNENDTANTAATTATLNNYESKVKLGMGLFHNRQPSIIKEESSGVLSPVMKAGRKTFSPNNNNNADSVSLSSPSPSFPIRSSSTPSTPGLTFAPSSPTPQHQHIQQQQHNTSPFVQQLQQHINDVPLSDNNNTQQYAPVRANSNNSPLTNSKPALPHIRRSKDSNMNNLQLLQQQQYDPRHHKNNGQQHHHHSFVATTATSVTSMPLSASSTSLSNLAHHKQHHDAAANKQMLHFFPLYTCTRVLEKISRVLLKRDYSPHAAATWIGFWALLTVTCSNHIIMPMRDAIALSIGYKNIPILTLVSTMLAFVSSVPIGWLFEAPDPNRRRLWKRMGITRGETQGTSLALFYRCFSFILLTYAVLFSLVEWFNNYADAARTYEEQQQELNLSTETEHTTIIDPAKERILTSKSSTSWVQELQNLWKTVSMVFYIAFFLIVHLMKLHSISLVWGVVTEAMEYEEVARKKTAGQENNNTAKARLQRLALVGFGGTLGGILGSGLASSMAHLLRLSGLLVMSALLLEISAELSIEMGRIMQKHWTEQQLFQSTNDLASLDASMKRSASMGSMKRVASGNSLYRIQSATELNKPINGGASGGTNNNIATSPTATNTFNNSQVTPQPPPEEMNDNTFFQRLMRGITTILRSRLLMAIFTYNALYASTTVLLSFQRAELVANRKDNSTTEADTAFLANINMASSIAIFALQATGAGALLAHACGPRGTLALMPMIRLLGVLSLAWWHQFSGGKSPNLLLFLFVDEATKIMNLAVAKPVRESLWRGLSNEARYEAKPIVDTIANRWGGGSAAFMVSVLNKVLGILGVQADPINGVRQAFGFPPIIFLCFITAAWWAAVSAELGHIRKRIDAELKKRV